MAKVLLVIKGGFGDAFPLFALGQELAARGHRVTVAGEAHHAAACNSLGIDLIDLGENGRAALAEPGGSMRAALADTLAPSRLDEEVEALLPQARMADLLIGNQLAYAGAIARDLTGKPWVYCAASPLSIPSSVEPPLWPYARAAQQSHAGRRVVTAVTRIATRVLMSDQIRLRRRLGLCAGPHPRFEGLYSADLNLLMTSPLLAAAQPDWPRNTVVSGFGWFEPRFIGDGGQMEQLAAFAQAGSPPVVFAPGGGLRAQPRAFIEDALGACHEVGCRGIIVTGKAFHQVAPSHPDILFTGYFPYARLFPLARAIVHSGGIGTIGWSLRHAVPSLLVPAQWDQFDNADRAWRSGLAHRLARRRGGAIGLAKGLRALFADARLQQHLRALQPKIHQENGAKVGADAVEALLSRP